MNSPTAMVDRTSRGRFIVRGVVQGVGFRPFVARLAAHLELSGFCRNDSSCVEIEVEGPTGAVAEFAARLRTQAPPLARIDEVQLTALDPIGGDGFEIEDSATVAGQRTLVPPDAALCDDCLAELFDPTNRRHLHPFITCTNCGPRLSIILDLPYDRPLTTMAEFTLCDACAAEYADPLDRRHHAQPIGCHDCGPRLSLTSLDGRPVDGDPIEAASELLLAGAVVAVKGIGGFHLAVDAANEVAVARLRRRKQRPDQPFALMVADLAAASTLIETTAAMEEVLTGPARPIVVAARIDQAGVAEGVAPGLDEWGVMIAYTGVHHLLLRRLAERGRTRPVLVMTSGNVSGEPLCHHDDEASERLAGIADAILGHDREIAVPVEDSVIAWGADDTPVLLRRSRGYAPLPIAVPSGSGVVLAAGAEVKNTVALADHTGRAFVSSHVGDLESLPSRHTHDLVSRRLLQFHRVTPDLVVADAHPGYASTAWAHRTARRFGVDVLEVQHHHAHLAALAAEHGHTDPLLGLVFDGTGYGCDRTVWGGEVLLLDRGGLTAERLGHLGRVRLPGGDAGVRNPVRTAALAALDAGLDLDQLDLDLQPAERRLLTQAARTGIGVVDTTSVGRLFDVVSALLGIRTRISYEAQAAIELEACARRWLRHHHPDEAPALDCGVVVSPQTGLPSLDVGSLIKSVTTARLGHSRGAVAAGFHLSLAAAGVEVAARQAARLSIVWVGLSGGVFCNRLLLAAVSDGLRARDLRPLVHRSVPANDGGLSLGQLLVGISQLQTPDVTRSITTPT